MAINTDPRYDTFNNYFPTFSGGKRSIIFISIILDINIDFHNLSEQACKDAIGQRLNMQEKIYRHDDVRRYLSEIKLDHGLFDFVFKSRFDYFLIKEEIVGLMNLMNLEKSISVSMANLSLHPKDAIIFLMDYWNFEIIAKEKYILDMKSRFLSVENTLKPLQWFQKDDDKVIAARDFFNRGKSADFIRINDVDDIKIFFYQYIDKPDSIYSQLAKIKSLFSNRKAKSNKNSRQCNFSLSPEIDDKISKIALSSKMTRSAVVESVFGEIEISRRLHKLKF